MTSNIKLSSWIISIGFCLSMSLTAYCQNTQNAERDKGAVRVMTKEVAQRVFGTFATEKARGENKPAHFTPIAQEIADKLKVSKADVDAFVIIKAIDTKSELQGATTKLSELANSTLSENLADDQVIDALEKSLIAWRKKYKGEHKAYHPASISKEEVRLAVASWLKTHPLATRPNAVSPVGTTATTTNPGEDDTSEETERQKKEQEEASNKALGFNLLWFVVGALLSLGAGIWFWYRPKQQLARNWKKVSKLVRDINRSLSPPHPNTGPLLVEQLTDLIETLHNQANPTASASRGQTNSDREIIRKLQYIVGNGDLVEAVRGLKEEAQRSHLEPEPKTQVMQTVVQPIAVVGSQNRSPVIVVYFSQPNPEGWFDDSQRNTQPTPDTCYRFMLPNNAANTALFSFEASPERVPRFLNLRNYFIDPACEPQNNFQSGHSRVVTLRDGKARLSNGQWRVETKAQIRFE